jgi:DNA modification methylase
MVGSAQVIRANSRHLPLADNSVDLVVTSPPYFALRSYQDGGEHYAGQIGDEPTPAEFVASLLEVTAECVRALKPSGSLWVNLGDKYGPGKSLIGIPWRYALACIDDLGLILRAEVIWSKPNGLPESVTDRVRRSHEQWFHFTLQPRYFSAVDEIREAHNAPAKPSGMAKLDGRSGQAAHTLTAVQNPLGKLPGSVWTVPTEPLRVPESLGIDHFAAFPTEWPRRIIQGWSPSGICVECGEGRRPVSERTLTHNRKGRQTQRESCAPISGGDSNQTLGWEREVSITGYACACSQGTAEEAHYLPPTRPAVVLDPFGGTGTTALVAKALGRHGISVDMSADYCRLAEWRTNDRNQIAKVLGIEKVPEADPDQLDLFGGAA